ncbi:MAG TPA: HD domain-containing phosphohydrolase [Solirubrobacteraceae bacterium]|jgi:response regulator RpfG family c-di-GMP phosphodiesterase|nr:HD domain-containing phosphohydrolase [Solirubrobacteraceae bacterium]
MAQATADRNGSQSAWSREGLYVLLKVLNERTPGVLDDLNKVARLATATAEAMGLSEEEVDRVDLAGRVHNVGNLAIPDAILNKPGALFNEEFEIMCTHSEIGARIVAAAPSLAHVAPLVRSHHERYDGRGYPDGLAGEKIPIGARIIAVCAAFVAMMRQRPFSDAITVEEAIAEIRKHSGSQFDPNVAQAFCELMRLALG